MPFVRFSASKRYIYIVAVILLLGKIMPTCSCCVLKGLVYITIIALLGCQSSFYTKCTKLNMRLSCDIKLVFNAKYVFFTCFYVLRSLQLLYLICFRVLCDSCCGETRF